MRVEREGRNEGGSGREVGREGSGRGGRKEAEVRRLRYEREGVEHRERMEVRRL